MVIAKTHEGYDIIGDIHGQGDELLDLLERLGFCHAGMSYTHENRQALFLGDLVDRGDQQKLVLVLGKVALPDDLTTGCDEGEAPVLFGHCWFEAKPAPITDNVACLDYSVPRPSGQLVAYRWTGEPSLQQENFIGVANMRPEH